MGFPYVKNCMYQFLVDGFYVSYLKVLRVDIRYHGLLFQEYMSVRVYMIKAHGGRPLEQGSRRNPSQVMVGLHICQTK